MPAAMARVFQGFAAEKALKHLAEGIILTQAKDYYPQTTDGDHKGKDDSPWIKRFADDGGKVVISGDTNMKKKAHERLALVDAGITTIFFPGPWSGWKFCQKMALLMHWWPAILALAKDPKPGFWMVPLSYPKGEDAVLRPISSEDLQMTKMAGQIAQGPARRAARKRSLDNNAVLERLVE